MCYCQSSHTNVFMAMAPVLYVHFLIFRLNLSSHLHSFVFVLLGKNIQTVVLGLASGEAVVAFHCGRKKLCDTIRFMTNPYMAAPWLKRFCRWLPIAAARVRSRVWSSGICGGQSGTGAGFLRVLRFPLPIFIPPIAPHTPSPII
jgi:hypothetical protein